MRKCCDIVAAYKLVSTLSSEQCMATSSMHSPTFDRIYHNNSLIKLLDDSTKTMIHKDVSLAIKSDKLAKPLIYTVTFVTRLYSSAQQESCQFQSGGIIWPWMTTSETQAIDNLALSRSQTKTNQTAIY